MGRWGDIDGVCGTGTAEADHGVMARVLALLDEMDAGGGTHALDHDLVDAPGGFLDRKAEWRGHRRDGLACRLEVERHAAAEEEAGVVIAEHQIGVGHGRLHAAHAIAGRARIGAGRMRADLEQADLVDRGDRAAARADLDHVDDGRLDRQARTLGETVDAAGFEHRRDLGAAVLDHAGLGGGAAHVEGDHVLMAGEFAEQGGGEAAAGRAAFEQADREGACRLGRDQAAGRMHQRQRTTEGAGGELALQALEIAAHQRLDIGVGRRGDEALVLPDLGHDLARQRDGELRAGFADDAGRFLLMGRVAVAVEEADRDRLAAGGIQLTGGVAHGLGIERGDDLAVTVDPLGHLEAELPRNQRIGEGQEQVVNVVALLRPHFEDVAEALGGDQAELGALAFDHGVGDERGAVDDVADIGERDAGHVDELAQPDQRRFGRVVRRRQALVQAHRALLRVVEDEIGEGAADVEADTPTIAHGAVSAIERFKG